MSELTDRHHDDAAGEARAIPAELRYCPRCAGRLRLSDVDGTTRPVCERCQYVFYLDPKLAVAVLIPMQGGILLGKRAIEPRRGYWSFPGGYVDRGEVVEKAAIREVFEETGLSIDLGRLLGLYSAENNPVVLAVYVADGIRGRPRAGKEVLELHVYSVEDLPEMAFPYDLRIIGNWAEQKSSKESPQCGFAGS